MQILNSRVDVNGFFRSLARAPERVLMLDYDGTLAPFHIDPAKAQPYPGILRALDSVAGMTRIVVVSGRPAQELVPFLTLKSRPEIWGTHGWERLLPDGSLQVRKLAASVKSALDEAEQRAAEVRRLGARLERKAASVALHWRGLQPPVATWIAQWAQTSWSELAHGGELELLPFESGMELRAAGCSKADAVTTVLSEAPEQSSVAYLGDDFTDEDAFQAVKPHGLAVLVRDNLRQTSADLWLKPPHELLGFLARWCAESA